MSTTYIVNLFSLQVEMLKRQLDAEILKNKSLQTQITGLQQEMTTLNHSRGSITEVTLRHRQFSSRFYYLKFNLYIIIVSTGCHRYPRR